MIDEPDRRAANSETLAMPRSLNDLRTTVRDWTRVARDAVLGYRRAEDNSFWRDSKFKALSDGTTQPEQSETATSRCFMALAAADRALGDEARGKKKADWHTWRGGFRLVPPFVERGGANQEVGGEALSNFELAHLADLEFASSFLRRVAESESEPEPECEFTAPIDEITDALLKALTSETALENGKLAFEGDAGHHHFVTLHALRALEIIGSDPGDLTKLAEGAKRFCIEQCFYAQRENRHEFDVFSLAFAGVVYVIYSANLDADLCDAIFEAVESAQRENGYWPASHPIFREKRSPWHITSHEIPLCLTWVYFQPRLPETVRDRLLAMMERYFRQAVMRSFTTTAVPSELGGPLKGWFNDSAVEDGFAAGWTTAIVCHFLANYCGVLDQRINCRVIQELGLAEQARHYEIGETMHEASARWKPETHGKKVTWPDLPPFAWCPDPPDEARLTREVTSRWTDPSGGEKSRALARSVLLPIRRRPSGRPDSNGCAAILPGSPGTRKTTLVKEVAKILHWPYVPIPASLIFDQGFDRMEARATEVFRQLNYLRSCVIFFDEWEEFFRSRPTDTEDKPQGNRDRTIAAFTTASMLPRLQDLHDQESCLIFFATNDETGVDNAILRPGRFDFTIKIEHPGLEGLKTYLSDPELVTVRTLEAIVAPPMEEGMLELTQAQKAVFDGLATEVLRALNEAEERRREAGGSEKAENEREIFTFSLVEAALRAAAKTESVDGAIERHLKRHQPGMPPLIEDLDS